MLEKIAQMNVHIDPRTDMPELRYTKDQQQTFSGFLDKGETKCRAEFGDRGLVSVHLKTVNITSVLRICGLHENENMSTVQRTK